MENKKKHILVISQYFYPEQFRINDICKEWIKRGYKITVLTGIPNYPKGKFFKGYGIFQKRKEVWNEISIIRVPIIARGNRSIGLIANYVSFVASGFIWKTFTRVKADYVFNFEVSPMTQALVGVWYAKRRKIPNYLYVQDLWPENVEIVTGIHSPFVINPISKMVNYIYKKTTHIFATSPSFVESIQERCGEKNKVSYLPQYAEDFYKPVFRETVINKVAEIENDDTFKIVFTGNIGQAQGLEILPKAARYLKDEKLKLIIVGEGRNKDNFREQVKTECVEEMFVFIDRQPSEKIPNILACCDAAFLSFMDNPLFTKTIPAKLQSYMACGMPIIASASGETQRIIETALCGKCSRIGDVSSLVKEIDYLIHLNRNDLANMRKNSRLYYDKYFDKNRLLDEIDKYFQ